MTRPDPSTRLRGRWLLLARLIWLALAVLCFTMAAVKAPSLMTPSAYTCSEIRCDATALSPADQAGLAGLGLTLQAYSAYFTVLETAPTILAYLLVAVLIFWRKSDDLLAILTSIFLMTFNSAGLPYLLEPNWRWAEIVISMVGPTLFVPLFFIFPDGRFVPRWTRWLLLIFPVLAVTFPMTFNPGPLISALLSILFGSIVLVAFGSQFYRYRRVSTPVQRQQTKWVVLAAFMLPVSDVLLRAIFPAVLPWATQTGQARVIYNMLTIPLFRAAPFILLPVSFAFAILRYRLWDIDVLIRRTLVYSMLTGTLALVYLSIVLLLQATVQGYLGESSSPVLIVVSTLVVAALFNPLRVRIQYFIDRRFYRKKYDAEQVLGSLSASLRDEVDLDVLAQSILGVVDQTMQPASLGIWMKKQGKTEAANFHPLPKIRR